MQLSLNALGTTVTLQANNDITVTDAINLTTLSAGLTLQAGRSIQINNNITTNNGAVTITANETTANGVVDGERDAGSAVINMTNGNTIDAGNADITLILSDGAGLTNSDSGDITVSNLTTTGDVLIRNDGATNGGGILRTGTSTITAGTLALDISNASNTTGTIGTSGSNINTATSNIEAQSQGGDIYVSNTGT